MKLNKNNKLLLLGLVLTLYICYAFAFSNTIEYYNEYSSKAELVESAINNPEVLQQLAIKEKQLDAVLEEYSISEGESFQNELLKKVSALSAHNHLKVIDFKEPHIIVENEIKKSSYRFTLQGSFNGIMLLINAIENDATLGFVEHISFIKNRNYRTNTYYLTGEIILQKNETIKDKIEYKIISKCLLLLQ